MLCSGWWIYYHNISQPELAIHGRSQRHRNSLGLLPGRVAELEGRYSDIECLYGTNILRIRMDACSVNIFIQRVLNAWGWCAGSPRKFGSHLFNSRQWRICQAIWCHSQCGCWRTVQWMRRILCSLTQKLLWKATKLMCFFPSSQPDHLTITPWMLIMRGMLFSDLFPCILWDVNKKIIVYSSEQGLNDSGWSLDRELLWIVIKNTPFIN